MRYRFVALTALLAMAPLASAGQRQVTYYYSDPLGNVLAEADETGAVITLRDFSPYGRPVQGGNKDGVGYAGHMADAEIGLVYMQARFYDPDTGRFLSTDPHEATAGAIFFQNRFVYANNSPTRFTDAHGDKPGDKFATPEMAAYDALRFINPTSIADNHEYQGWITPVDNQFVATTPVQMSGTGGVTAAPGIPVVGDYHTHGDYSIRNADGSLTKTGDPAKDNLNSDNYSKSDRNRYESLAQADSAVFGGQHVYRGYLATPGDHYYVYDGVTKTQVDLAALVAAQLKALQNQPPPPPPPPPTP